MVQKKILIDSERLRYPNTGLANVSKNLIKGLVELNDTNNNLFFYGPKDYIKQIAPEAAIVPYKKWHRRIEFFSKGFDIVHSEHQLSLYFQHSYSRTKKILTLHDLNFLHEDLSLRKKKRQLKCVNANLKNTQYLVCISNFVKEDVLKNTSILQLDKLKEILVIHNGITFPINTFSSLQGKLAFLTHRPYLLNIGVLFHKKNQKALIEALPYLKEDLVIVASEHKEPYATEVFDTIRSLGVENRVHFFSNITEEEKNALIQHSEGLCQPSLAEGFGIPAVEAMALGKPVFLSTRTSLPEIGGDVAFYFQDFHPQTMADVITKGLQVYKQNKDTYTAKIKTWAKQFNYLTMAQNYLNLYNRI